MLTRARPPIRLYVFGSAVDTPQIAQDLDLLAIYDELQTPAGEVYGLVRPVVRMIAQLAGLDVHPTVLSIDEAESEDFLTRYGCVGLDDWLSSLRLATSTGDSSRRRDEPAAQQLRLGVTLPLWDS